MEIKVTFKFEAGDSFLACVEKFSRAAEVMVKANILETLPTKEKGVTKAIVTTNGVKINKKELVFEQNDVATPAPDTTAETEAAPKASAENAADTGEAVPETDAPADGNNKELTTQDIREAMHRTRQRIEGEDYKDNPDSEGYKKYHKPLTAQFKNIAVLLGSDRPSTLPAEQRASFIRQCDELVIKDGEITTFSPY